MTIGNKTVDIRYFQDVLGAQLKVGNYFTKSWNGGDSAPLPPRGEKVTLSFTVDEIRNKKGKLIRPAKLITKSFYPDRPLKRVRYEDHPYSTTGFKTTIVPLAYRRKIDPDLPGYYSKSLAIVGNPTPSPPNVSDPWLASDDDRLYGKLADRIAGSTFDMGIFLAEGHQALTMIANTAATMYGVAKLARRGNFHAAAQLLVQRNSARGRKIPLRKSAGNNLLELRYGWEPLYQDVYNGARFLAHQIDTPAVIRVVARRNARGRHPDNPLLTRIDETTYQRWWAEVTSRKQVIAFLTENNSTTLTGLIDPATVAWEIIPGSFVFDWWIPIGQYLSNRKIFSGVSGVFVETKTFKVRSNGLPFVEPSRTLSDSVDIRAFKYAYWQQTRTVDLTPNFPFPRVRGFEEAASWRRATNFIALMQNLLPVKRR